jgi:hypothetical protein
MIELFIPRELLKETRRVSQVVPAKDSRFRSRRLPTTSQGALEIDPLDWENPRMTSGCLDGR